jgi:hypothetical protein
MQIICSALMPSAAFKASIVGSMTISPIASVRLEIAAWHDRSFSALFSIGLHAPIPLKAFCHGVPIDEIRQKGIDVFRTQIAIVDIVRMLPNITGQERGVAFG